MGLYSVLFVHLGIFSPGYRQLFVLQMIRFWTELLDELGHLARSESGQEISYFSEIFGHFYNRDEYFRGRKTWDKL